MKFTKSALAICAVLTIAPAVAQEQPNILFLIAEDLSPRIGAFGDDVAVTPNIDKLAEKSVKYTNVYTTAGVSAPSRAALITGMHQNSIGAGGMRTQDFNMFYGKDYRAVPPANVKAFPEILRRAGYWTYENTKLDYQFSGALPGTGPFTIWDAEASSTQGVYWNERTKGKPFFGMYAFLETHESGLFPRWDFSRGLFPSIMAVMQWKTHLGTDEIVTPEQVTVPSYYPDIPVVRETIAQQYNNSITMDKRVGEILAQLEEDNLSDDTIIIWTTDHGDGFPRVKREVYDSSLKVPMTIYWPEKWRPKHAQPGTTDNQLISFVDMAPTILTMAGAEVPENMIGNNFVVDGGSGREYIYAAKDRSDESEDRVRAISDGQFKYMRVYRTDVPAGEHIAFRDGLLMMDDMWRMKEEGTLTAVQNQWFELRPEEMLFDTKVDPEEINNIAKDPQYKEVMTRMRAELAKWQERDKDYAETPEIELAEQFWPNGEQPTTEVSELKIGNGKVVIVNPNSAASIGYRINGGYWELYTGPIEIKTGMRDIITKAVRYGWAESEDTFIRL